MDPGVVVKEVALGNGNTTTGVVACERGAQVKKLPSAGIVQPWIVRWGLKSFDAVDDVEGVYQASVMIIVDSTKPAVHVRINEVCATKGNGKEKSLTEWKGLGFVFAGGHATDSERGAMSSGNAETMIEVEAWRGGD